MKKRLFAYTTLILFAGLLSYFGASLYVTYTNNFNLARDTVMETAQICADLYSGAADNASFAKAGSDTRITIISAEGKVLADSRPLEVSALENHLSRPEIKAAAQGTPTAYVRYSETLGVDLIYYALKTASGGNYVFMRAAIPIAKIDAYLLQSLPLLVLLLLTLAILCFFFSREMIHRITRPFESVGQKLLSLTNGAYAPEISAGSYEEVNKITRGIDEVALVLRNSFDALRDEKAKLAYILDNIGDGLFVLDENKNIVLINSVALAIFNAQAGIADKSLHYLSYDKNIDAAVDDCINHGKNTLFEFSLNGHIYSAAVKPLPETLLTIVTLADVTENRENAKRREEFFANASHELKTPLTAIRGFNELLAINNKDEDVSKYISSMTRETDRMLSLIGNMLKLSELENPREINPVPVALAKIANEIREAILPALSEKAINFTVSGEAEATAEPGHIYDLVKNLIENAVRYNQQNGQVSVIIESEKKHVRLTVADDGAGIPPEAQSRIFERFYRVEKSRSQRNGGTGLGLAIVKHICVLYGWHLSLKSKVGLGTEVTVVFGPKD